MLDKRILYSGIGIVLFIFCFIFFSTDEKIEESSQNVETKDIKVETKKEVIAESKIVVREEKKEIIQEKKEEIISEKKEKKDEYIVLASFLANSGKYIVKIITDKEVENNDDSLIKYIPFRGEFSEYENNSKFNFSLDEKYLSSSNEIKILIDDTSTKEKEKDFECDGDFFSGLSADNIYNLKIIISGSRADCYILDVISMPEKAKVLLEKMKNITIDENNGSKLKFAE